MQFSELLVCMWPTDPESLGAAVAFFEEVLFEDLVAELFSDPAVWRCCIS